MCTVFGLLALDKASMFQPLQEFSSATASLGYMIHALLLWKARRVMTTPFCVHQLLLKQHLEQNILIFVHRCSLYSVCMLTSIPVSILVEYFYLH